MKKFLAILGISSLLMAYTTTANAQCYGCDCAPGVENLVNHDKIYHPLYQILHDNYDQLLFETNYVQLFPTQVNYNILLQTAYTIINTLNGSPVLSPVTQPDTGNALKVVSPRIVITQPDGTTIIDTAQWTGTGPYFRVSTFANWQANTINANQNTSVSIMLAQIWPCGIGLETIYNSPLQALQDYVALRLGDYLYNAGTIRISQNRFFPPSD